MYRLSAKEEAGLQKMIRSLSGWYWCKCPWHCLDDLRNEAWLYALEALDRLPDAVTEADRVVAYCRVAVRRGLGDYTLRMNTPVTTGSRGHRKTLPVSTHSPIFPEDIRAKPIEACPEYTLRMAEVKAVLDVIVQGLPYARDRLVGELNPRDIIEKHNAPAQSVKVQIERARVRARTKNTSRRLHDLLRP